MNEVTKFLKDAQTFYIATMDGDQPRVRPFGAVMEKEGKLYLITGNQKAFFAQIKANPKVEICTMSADGVWIRITAKAVPMPQKELKLAMLEEMPSLKDLYSVDDGIMEILELQDGSATFASFTAPPRTISF